MKSVLAVGAILFASTTNAHAVAQNVPRTRLRHAPATPLKHVPDNALIDLQSPLRTPVIPVAGGGMNDHEGGGLTNPPEEQFERPIHGGLPAWMAHDHPFQNGHVPGQVYNNHLKEAKEDVIIKPNQHVGPAEPAPPPRVHTGIYTPDPNVAMHHPPPGLTTGQHATPQHMHAPLPVLAGMTSPHVVP